MKLRNLFPVFRRNNSFSEQLKSAKLERFVIEHAKETKLQKEISNMEEKVQKIFLKQYKQNKDVIKIPCDFRYTKDIETFDHAMTNLFMTLKIEKIYFHLKHTSSSHWWDIDKDSDYTVYQLILCKGCEWSNCSYNSIIKLK